ncbi:MAG: HNH endonuclease [Promethearchaeota archaeon]|jgi:hypothetical protein
MRTTDFEKEIEILEKQADEIQNLAVDLIKSAPLKHDSGIEYSFSLLTEELRQLQKKVITKYNTWYNSVYLLIKKFLPHQLDEFKKRYRLDRDTVFTYDITRILELNVVFLGGDKVFIIEKFEESFTFQKSQLLSLKNIAIDVINDNLSSFNQLEESLVQNIYDYLLKNPTYSHSKSRSITTQKKNAVKDRDNFICQICEEKFSKTELEVDHIFPHSFRGSNQITNLMSLCKSCNADKGNRLEYYKSKEGKLKLLSNIREFVKNLLLIQNFGNWLKRAGDKRRKYTPLIAENEIRYDQVDEQDYEEIYDAEEETRRPNIKLLEIYLAFFKDSEISSEDLYDRLRRASFEADVYRNLKDMNEDEKEIGIKFIQSISENLLIREERNLISKALEILYNLSLNDFFMEIIKTNYLDQLIQFYKEKKYYSYLLEILDNTGYFTDILREIIQAIDDKNLELLEYLRTSIMSSYRRDGIGIVKALQLKQKEIRDLEENLKIKEIIRKFIKRIEGLIAF